jgi:hypothetical protein
MVVIIMLEQRVVGVVGLEAADSRIRTPSSTAPGACLGHEPGDTKGQLRSQADSRDLALSRANTLEQRRPYLLTRYQAHESAIRAGWKLRSEVRDLEDLPPVAGIDDQAGGPAVA